MTGAFGGLLLGQGRKGYHPPRLETAEVVEPVGPRHVQVMARRAVDFLGEQRQRVAASDLPLVRDVGRGQRRRRQLLGGILGSKDASRQVATQASQHSGLDPALLKQMLPILAMLVAGHLARRSGDQPGGLGGILTSVLGSLAGGGGVSSP